MTNLPRRTQKSQKQTPGIAEGVRLAEAAGFRVQPCHLCGVPVIWASTGQKHSGHRHPIAVELVELGQGAIALQPDLALGGAPSSPQAYETATSTRFAWHGPRCSGPGSFTSTARAPKVRR